MTQQAPEIKPERIFTASVVRIATYEDKSLAIEAVSQNGLKLALGVSGKVLTALLEQFRLEREAKPEILDWPAARPE